MLEHLLLLLCVQLTLYSVYHILVISAAFSSQEEEWNKMISILFKLGERLLAILRVLPHGASDVGYQLLCSPSFLWIAFLLTRLNI